MEAACVLTASSSWTQRTQALLTTLSRALGATKCVRKPVNGMLPDAGTRMHMSEACRINLVRKQRVGLRGTA